MTPSLPTLSIASAMISPISLSPLAEIVPTWAISSRSLTFLDCFLQLSTTASTALSMPRLRLHRVGAGGDVLQALAVDRLGEHGGGGGAVAGDVVGLAGDLLHHLGAHVLELVSSSISLATVTPSLVTVGAPKLLVDDDVAALGAERDLDGRSWDRRTLLALTCREC
jgi:hypothetical protein